MAIHRDFPTSPHSILEPDVRWFPADEALRESSYEKLPPPLVHELRKKVKAWRDSGYDVLYGKVKYFIQDELFEKPVDLDSLNTLRNLSELEASKTLVETFKKQINALTVQDKGDAKGEISNYYPDFIVKKSAKEIFIIETKGLEDLDVPLKMERLKQWCIDINKAQSEIKYDYVFVDEESFDKFKPKSFEELIRSFTKYRAGMVAASSS